MLLRLTKGATTVTLSGDGAAINSCTYVPRPPEIDDREIIELMRTRQWETLRALRVVESAVVNLEGTTTEILDQQREIESLLPWRRARNDTERLFVEYRVESSGDIYRAEVYGGRVSLPEVSPNRRLDSGVLQIIAAWEREPWWNGPEAQVRLWNPVEGFVSVGGITISNHKDTSDTNVADPGPVDGVLPAACRIVVRNADGGNVSYRNIYIGQNTYPDAASFLHTLEGEDNETGGGSVQPGAADTATYSEGYYYQRTWGGAITHSTVLYEWTLSGSQMVIADGRWYRLLARLVATPNTTTRVKATLHRGAQTFYETPEVALSGTQQLQDLGVLQLPPALTGLAALGDITLRLTARDTAAGSLSIDFVQLTPTDGWRHLATLGGTYADGTEFVDDGLSGLLYTDEGSNDIYANLVAGGSPILLWPGVDQRLIFLFDEVSASEIGRTSEVEVHYRPRRSTL